jgi:mono/diheme cytochrome c family protein
LTEQQLRGAAVFFQRCSLCHLAKTSGAGGSKYCCVASLGPDLSGRFTDVTPDEEQAFRAIILNGGPTYMPSWKYGLTLDEIDDIIAYLKTLG